MSAHNDKILQICEEALNRREKLVDQKWSDLVDAKNSTIESLRTQIQEGLERELALIREVIHFKREIEIKNTLQDGMNSALDLMHRHVENLKAELQQCKDHIDRLEAIPRPAVPLPGLTMQALGVLCRQQRSLEIERLRAEIVARDAEIQRLRDAMDNEMSDEED